MPFQSEEQRKYLWANEPAIAKRWEKYPKGYNTGGVSHLFRSKEPAQGGYIHPEDSGVLGLADGGQLVKPGPGRPGYNGEYDPGGWGPGVGSGGDDTPTDDRDYEEQAVGTPYENIYTAPTYPTYPDEGGERDDPGSVSYEDPMTQLIKEQEEERPIEYYGQKKIQYEEKVLTDRTNEYILRNLQKLDPTKYYEDMNAFKKFIEVGKSIPTPTILGLLKALYDEHKLTSEGKGILDDWKKYVGGPPGSNPEAYDALWLALEKRKGKYRYKGEEEREGDKTTTTIEEDAIKYPTQEEMMAASRRAYEMLYGDRRRAEVIPEDRSKQMAYYNAYRNKYMSAQGGRVPGGYNTGGLSNLFRLKNT